MNKVNKIFEYSICCAAVKCAYIWNMIYTEKHYLQTHENQKSCRCWKSKVKLENVGYTQRVVATVGRKTELMF